MHHPLKRHLGYLFPNATWTTGRLYRAVSRAWKIGSGNSLPREDYAALYGAFTIDALFRFLREWGVRDGDILMIHSSLDKIPHLDGSALELIEALQALVGPGGTLCMAAFPALAMDRPDVLFDVRKTPSSTGLLGEVFRRCPGVQRSLQDRSVAARGRHAEALLADHHRSPYPSGVLSPYYRIAREGGKVLTLGISAIYSAMFHCGEDVLQDEFPAPVYGRTPFKFQARSAAGEIFTVLVKRLKLRYYYKCDTARLLKYFPEDEISHRAFHGVPCSLAHAGPFLDRLLRLARSGIHIYGSRFPDLTCQRTA